MEKQGVRPVKFHFKNIGPVKEAELELGDLTIIAGRNNTGKTSLVYALYGLLQTWQFWSGFGRLLPRGPAAVNGFSFLRKISRALCDGAANITVDCPPFNEQRAGLLRAIAAAYSKKVLPEVFKAQGDEFKDASIRAEYAPGAAEDDLPTGRRQMTDVGAFSFTPAAGKVSVSFKRAGPPSRGLDKKKTAAALEYAYISFLLTDTMGALPCPFVLTSERSGASLFLRDLDFAKSRMVDRLQNMATEGVRDDAATYAFVNRAASRYAMPVRDNIDYARDIPDLGKAKSEFWESRLFDDIKELMGGDYRVVNDEVRFVSRTRDKNRSFNLPLHRASAAAQELSGLYFFLRHTACKNHLLVIDEPESHLDTANQVLLARLLARCVRAGLKVLVSTHSDYLLKEINNLIMLSRNFPGQDKTRRRFKYAENDALDPAGIRAYIADEGGVTRRGIDCFGIDMPVFDDTIHSINNATYELANGILQNRENQ